MKLLSSKKSKAQLISTEFFMVSVVITLLFSVSVVFWNQSNFRIKESDERANIEISTLAISDHLLKSRGLPSDWEDRTNEISHLGLAKENHVFDNKKLNKFISLDYNQVKNLLGISQYEFLFLIRNLTGTIIGGDGMLQGTVAYLAINEGFGLEALNNSATIWDFYWCSSNKMPGSNARNAYQILDKRECFGDMIENRSLYNSIFAENPDINVGDFHPTDPKLNVSHKEWLKNFVSEGNRYIQDEHGSVACIFDMSGCGESKGTIGIVESLEYLTNYSIGDEVHFKEASSALFQGAGDKPLNKIISAKDDRTRALFGYWNYDNGKVFYIADMEDVESKTLAFKLTLATALIKYGKEPKDANYVINSRRLAIYNNEIVYVDVILWQ